MTKRIRTRINDKNKEFIREYVRNGYVVSKAYMDVYKTDNQQAAATQGRRILLNKEAQEYLHSLIEDDENNAIATLNDCLVMLTKIMNDNNSSNTEKLKAIDMRLKTLGVYLQRMQIDDGININVSIDDE